MYRNHLGVCVASTVFWVPFDKLSTWTSTVRGGRSIIWAMNLFPVHTPALPSGPFRVELIA
jgi:hypothetical protein